MPFGGIQLVFIGDFAQLPPAGAVGVLGIRQCSAFAFQSVCWREARVVCLQLTEIYRQRGDPDFIGALADVREARDLTPVLKQLVKDCARPLAARPGQRIPGGLKPTQLVTRNKAADELNRVELELLQAPAVRFEAVDSVFVDKFFKSGCQAGSEVQLKVDAQVMLLCN
ncbi:hypothetical protein M885DRAFT_438969, partial [Pelagophyceae sp. CCMP2097]